MILVIDNYDSFTYNLVQMLAGVEVEVVRNDVMDPEGVLDARPSGVILSPGPGRPENAGICVDLLRLEAQVPMLGVCLGHQSLGHAFGAVVDRAPVLMHGKTSEVLHEGAGLLESLPSPFVATRYHSLEVRADSLPDCLEAVAHTEDGTIMALRHRELPYFGVQFHPESVLTEAGQGLIQNFLQCCGLTPRPVEDAF